MGKYLTLFENHSSYETYINGPDAILPNVSYCKDVKDVHFNPYHDYSKDYLTFNILSDGYFCFTCNYTAYAKTIQYSKNNGEWTSLTSDINTEVATAITVDGLTGTFTYGGYDVDIEEYYWENNGTKLYYESKLIGEGDYVHDENWAEEYEVLTAENDFVGTKINVVNGDIVNFRGDNATYNANYFNAHCNFIVEGNIMSLIDSTGFTTATTLASSFTFNYLFSNCTSLTSAENLILPATTLADYCYCGMFRDCTSLTSAPALPATTLAQYCYQQMFRDCTSLTSAPALPATTLASYCYFSMFQGCTSLNYIKCLATNISSTRCTSDWVNGVASAGTFVKNPSMSSWTTGSNGIPANWTVQDAS